MLCKARVGNLVVLIKEIENKNGGRELHDDLRSLHCKTNSFGGGGEPGLCGTTSCESINVLHNGINGDVGMRGSVSTSCSFSFTLFFLSWDECINRYCDGNKGWTYLCTEFRKKARNSPWIEAGFGRSTWVWSVNNKHRAQRNAVAEGPFDTAAGTPEHVADTPTALEAYSCDLKTFQSCLYFLSSTRIKSWVCLSVKILNCLIFSSYLVWFFSGRKLFKCSWF